MRKIFVRIARGKTNTTFHRAGMTFTKKWLAIGADEATASCLYAEQMLEVTDIDPSPEVLPIVVELPESGVNAIDTTVNGADLDLSEMGLDVQSTIDATDSTALGNSTVRGEPVEPLSPSTGSELTVNQNALDTAKKKGKG